MASEQDLDLFLAGVESKLRGPFTPLDLTKVIVTPALRGTNVSIATYVQQLAQVFHRTEKVIQMGIVLALGALMLREEVAGDEQVHQTILEILETAQQSSAQEEWVKIVAGLVESILFSSQQTEGEQDQEQQRESQQMLQKACHEIIESVQQLEQETAQAEAQQQQQQQADEQLDAVAEDDGNTSSDNAEATAYRKTQLHTADIDPTLAPYMYHLLKPQILQQVIPEATEHYHFTVNENADLLHLDNKLEARKAKEEAEHNIASSDGKGDQAAAAGGGGNAAASSASKKVVAPGPIMPGMKRLAAANNKSSTGMSAAAKAKLAATRQSKMFLNRKPAQAAAAAKGGGLHVRKAGASQRLVGKGRQVKPGDGAAGGSGGGLAGTTTGKTSFLGAGGGRVAKLRDAKASKMKVLDMSEVQGLAKEKEASAAASAANNLTNSNAANTLGPKKGIKRKADQAAATAGKMGKMAKKSSTPSATATSPSAKTPAATNGHAKAAPATAPVPVPAPAPVATQPAPAPMPAAFAAGGLVAAALSNYQRQVAAGANDNKPASPAPPPPPPAADPPVPPARANHAHHGHHHQLDWRQLLAQRSNKLSDEDRRRVQMFFEERRNPTPGEIKYRVKLHEERTSDQNTGEPIKETYYLNLDYSTWTSNQSKKRKRYND